MSKYSKDKVVVPNSSTSEGSDSSFDSTEFYAKLNEWNKRKVDKLKCDGKWKSMTVVISGIQFAGMHGIEHEFDSKLTPEQEIEEANKYPGTTFKTIQKDGKMTRVKCYTGKPVPTFFIFVDLPNHQVEGIDGKKAPIRISLNGSFNPKGSKKAVPNMMYEYQVRRLCKVKNTTLKAGDNGPEGFTWGANSKSSLGKLAEYVGVAPLTLDKLFDLLGKPIAASVKLELVEYNGKTYFNEKIKGLGPVLQELVDAGAVPVLDEDYYSFWPSFDNIQVKEDLLQCRSIVLDTMLKDKAFFGSEAYNIFMEEGEDYVKKKILAAEKAMKGADASSEGSEAVSEGDNTQSDANLPGVPEEGCTEGTGAPEEVEGSEGDSDLQQNLPLEGEEDSFQGDIPF